MEWLRAGKAALGEAQSINQDGKSQPDIATRRAVERALSSGFHTGHNDQSRIYMIELDRC